MALAHRNPPGHLPWWSRPGSSRSAGCAYSEWGHIARAVAAPAPAAHPQPFPPVGGGGNQGAPQARKLKLSAVLGPTLDAEIGGLQEQEVAAMYQRYKDKFDDFRLLPPQ